MPPEEPPQISVLDARLAEIDRRLSSIQTGLAVAGEESPNPAPAAELPPRVEVAEPPSAAPSAAPAPAPTELATVLDELRRLTVAQEQVLQSTRGLLAAYERVLTRLAAEESATAAVREFSVSAGPFSSTEALRGFRQTLAEIPQVREVSVRGFEGGDRAIVDVQLFEANP